MRGVFAGLVAAVLFFPSTASAQQLLESYAAYIGTEDLYNSKGARLTEPWQVLRQDRANFHRFGIRHAGDEGDSFFASMENRAAMERMLMGGHIDPTTRRILMGGGAVVFVRIWGRGGRGDYIDVTVTR